MKLTNVSFLIFTLSIVNIDSAENDDMDACNENLCMSGTVTRVNLESYGDKYFKVNGEGPTATFSVLEGWDTSNTSVDLAVVGRKLPGQMQYSLRSTYGPFCQLIPTIHQTKGDSYLLKNKVVQMLLPGYEGCSEEPKEYQISTGFSGLFSLVKNQIFTKIASKSNEFEVTVRIAKDWESGVLMYLKVVLDKALTSSHGEETTSQPTTPELTTLAPTTDKETPEPGGDPEYGTEPMSTSGPEPMPTSEPEGDPGHGTESMSTSEPEDDPGYGTEPMPTSEPGDDPGHGTEPMPTSEPEHDPGHGFEPISTSEPTSTSEPGDDPGHGTEPMSTSEPGDDPGHGSEPMPTSGSGGDLGHGTEEIPTSTPEHTTPDEESGNSNCNYHQWLRSIKSYIPTPNYYLQGRIKPNRRPRLARKCRPFSRRRGWVGRRVG